MKLTNKEKDIPAKNPSLLRKLRRDRRERTQRRNSPLNTRKVAKKGFNAQRNQIFRNLFSALYAE